MAALGQSLSHSVAAVRRKLLQMMDALAEKGMRHAHREIVGAHEAERHPPKARKSMRKARKDSAVH